MSCPSPAPARSLLDTYYAEFRHNLAQSQWVDVQLVCYDDRGHAVVAQRSAHSIVLAAKSAFLGRLLCSQAGQPEAVRLVLAGFGRGDLERLISDAYDSHAQMEAVWATSESGSEEEEEETEVKGEAEVEDDAEQDNLDEAVAPKSDKILQDEALQRAWDRHGLTLPQVHALLVQGHPSLTLHPRGLHSSAWRAFRLVSIDGDRLPLAACRHCRKVYVYFPGKGSSALCKHAKQCPEEEKGAAVGEGASRQQRDAAPTAHYITHLLRMRSDKVETFAPDPALYSSKVWQRYNMVRLNGRTVCFVVCKSCRMVLVWNRKAGPSNLSVHACKRATSNDSGVADKVAKDELAELVRSKSSHVSLRAFLTMDGAAEKMRHVHFKGHRTPFAYCQVCKSLLEEATADRHECATVLKNLAQLHKSQPGRISVCQDVVPNILYPYIHPVRLDGRDTECAQCSQCHAFLLRQSVSSENFAHRCHRLTANGGSGSSSNSGVDISDNSARFYSDNLIPLDKTDSRRPRSFRCKLCPDAAVLSSAYHAEVHVRTVHGEGGAKVLCSSCGKAFATLAQARKHERDVHSDTSNASASPKAKAAKFTCPECRSDFSDRHSLKRHLAGLHSQSESESAGGGGGQHPYVCDVCGKGFRWEVTLRRHALIHGEKTFRCDFCAKAFFQRNTYTRHRMTHTGERPYACATCGQKFITRGGYKVHALKRHGVVVPRGKRGKGMHDRSATSAEET